MVEALKVDNPQVRMILRYALILIAALVGWFLSGAIARQVRKSSKKVVQSKHARNILATITQVSILIIIVIIILDILDLGATAASLAAGAGIIGIVIGYGSQSLFKEATAATIIYLKSQFRVGDWIKCGDYVGQVTSIGFKGVSMITTMNESLFLPATYVISKPLINYKRKTLSGETKELWQKSEVKIKGVNVDKVKQFAEKLFKENTTISEFKVITSEISPRKRYTIATITLQYKAGFDPDLNLHLTDEINSFCANLKETKK